MHDAIHDVESFGWSILCIVYRRALTELGPPPRHDETSLRYCLVREYALLFVASSISELVYQRGMAFSVLGGKDETRPIFKDWPEHDDNRCTAITNLLSYARECCGECGTLLAEFLKALWTDLRALQPVLAETSEPSKFFQKLKKQRRYRQAMPVPVTMRGEGSYDCLVDLLETLLKMLKENHPSILEEWSQHRQ